MTTVMKNTDMIPPCYIRLDVSHLIRMVSRWKCLKSSDKILVREFYIRCISQAYKIDSLKEIKYFLESVLIVALSKSIGCTIDGKPLMSNERMQYLNNIIKGNTNPIETDASDNDSDNENKKIESFDNDYSNHEENCSIS